MSVMALPGSWACSHHYRVLSGLVPGILEPPCPWLLIMKGHVWLEGVWQSRLAAAQGGRCPNVFFDIHGSKLYSLQLSAHWFSFSAAEVLFLDPFSGDHFGSSVSRRSEPWIQKSPSTHLSCPSYRKRQFFPSLSCMPSCGAGLTSDLALCGLLSPHLSPIQSVHGILQARILEWAAFSFSRGSFPTQGLNLGLLHCTQILCRLSPRGSSMSGSHSQLLGHQKLANGPLSLGLIH